MLLLCSFTNSNIKAAGAVPRGEGMETVTPMHFFKSSKNVEKNLGLREMILSPTTTKFLPQSVLLMTSIFQKRMSFHHFFSHIM